MPDVELPCPQLDGAPEPVSPSRGAAPARGVFLLFLSLPSPLLSAQGKLPALQTAAPHALLAQGALPPALRLLR